MSKRRLDKLQDFLTTTKDQIILHEERLRLQYQQDGLERPKFWQRGYFLKNEAESELVRLTERKLKLERQLQRLKRNVARAELEPSVWSRVQEAGAITRERVAAVVDTASEYKDRFSRWWREHIKAELPDREPLSAGEQAAQRMEQNLQKYFPDEWEKKQGLKRYEQEVAQIGSRYWTERLKEAERAERREERQAAKAARRASREQQREWREQKVDRLEAEAPQRAELNEEIDTLTEVIREHERKEPQW